MLRNIKKVARKSLAYFTLKSLPYLRQILQCSRRVFKSPFKNAKSFIVALISLATIITAHAIDGFSFPTHNLFLWSFVILVLFILFVVTLKLEGLYRKFVNLFYGRFK